MMPLNLFRSRTFTGANTLTLLLYGAMNSVLFFLPLSLIQVQGYSAAAVGFALLPMTVLMVALSFAMSRVIDRYGPRLPLIVGPVLISLSFVMLATLQPESGQDTLLDDALPRDLPFRRRHGRHPGAANHRRHGIGRRASRRHGLGLNNTVSRSAQVLAIAVMGGIVLVLFKQTLLSDPSPFRRCPPTPAPCSSRSRSSWRRPHCRQP